MKKPSILFVALFWVNCAMGQGCLPFGVEFTTQSQIDNFPMIFPNCNRIEGPVKIQGNDITNLTALSQINFLGSALMIYSNSNLPNLHGLENIDSIMGFLDIAGNPSLKSLAALNNLVYTGGLALYANDSLKTLAGLDNLTVIQGSLGIQAMKRLQTLSNLINLTSIRGNLDIYENDSLISLTGLDNINADSIINLWINYNNVLSNCAVQSICNYIVNPFGANVIQQNASGCQTISEVVAACATIGVECPSQESSMSFYPNPASNTITITTPEKGYISVHNLNGKQLLNQKFTESKTLMNVSNLPPGIYLIKFINQNTVEIRKLIRE